MIFLLFLVDDLDLRPLPAMVGRSDLCLADLCLASIPERLMSGSAARAVVTETTLVGISVVAHVYVPLVVAAAPATGNGALAGITIGNVAHVHISVHVTGVADSGGAVINDILTPAGIVVLPVAEKERTVTVRIRPAVLENEIDTTATVVIVPGTIIIGIAAIITIFGTATKEQTGERRRNEKKEFLHNPCAGDRFSPAYCMYWSTHF